MHALRTVRILSSVLCFKKRKIQLNSVHVDERASSSKSYVAFPLAPEEKVIAQVVEFV